MTFKTEILLKVLLWLTGLRYASKREFTHLYLKKVIPPTH
jgi:hypothetical protein